MDASLDFLHFIISVTFCQWSKLGYIFVPLWLKMPSISMEDLEWAMQSIEQGTRPSWAGERSVVLTRHQSGLSWQRSRTSTVWPRRTVSSLLLLAIKSCMTTVSSQPPESCGRQDHHWDLCSIWHLFLKLIIAEGLGIISELCVCVLTLSLSSVFWEVRDAREMVSGWLLPSPWLSRSSPSLAGAHTINKRFLPFLYKNSEINFLFID